MSGRLRPRPGGAESGQIILVVATVVCFVLITAAALAIDFGNSLVQKRILQNAADAAAVAATHILATGGSETDAVLQAQSLVSANTGGTVSLPYPGTGSGAGLTQGVEVSGGGVRVALRRNVGTFFAPIVGVNSLAVSARSRAAVGPFGTLPIAIKRFSAGDTSVPLGSGGNPTSVYDYLRPAVGDEIATWPSPLSSPAPVAAGYTSPDVYSPAVSGRVFAILGQDSQASVSGGNDFHGFLAPDVRGVTQVVPTFYNGVSTATSIQSLKDIESSYFLSKGYPGPNPAVGAQIGVLNGTTTSHTVDAVRKVFQRGDVISTFVYNGTVYRKPEFDLTVDAAVKSSSDIGPEGSPITFQVTLEPRNGFISGGVEFSATGLTGWADWRFNSGSLNTTQSVPVGGGAVVLTFEVSATSAVEGVRTALIRGYDPSSGNYRTISATVVVGSAPSYSLSCAEGYKVIEQGSAARFDLKMQGWNGYPSTEVTVATPQWFSNTTPPVPTPGPAGVTVSVPSTVRVRDGQGSNLRVDISAGSSATIGEWMLKIATLDGDSTRNQDILLTVRTILSGTGPSAGNTTSFVNVLGYVNVVITYANNASTPSPSLDNNTLYGYVVSPLVPSLSDLTRGLPARLVSWSQGP